ncbi:MAG: NAD(P)/FAD-dependent oxidoreductase [Kiloniellaceae bacterium]
MSNSADFDVVVVGAGAAGVGAGRALAQAGSRFVIVEARERVGGRAWTVDSGRGYPIDLGCEWLHSAPRNPMVGLARERGMTVDEYPHIWADEWNLKTLGEAAYRAFRGTVDAAFDRAAALAEAGGPDVAFGDLLDAGSPWRAATDAICGWMTGGRLDQVSAVDMGRMDDLYVNWRLPGGYGTLIANLAADLPIRLSCPVTRIDWHGRTIAVETAAGRLTAGRVIVTLPTDVIAAGAVDFAPALPADKLQAAADLPLGADLKLFLAVEGAPFGPPRDLQLPSRYDHPDGAFLHLHPFGRPLVAAYLGGDIARRLEAAGLAAMADFAEQELVRNFGTGVRGKLQPIAASGWMADPLAGGAYAYARPGAVNARAALAAPLDDRLFFAGEATLADEFATAHGAYRSGLAAGRAATAALIAT